MTTGKFIAAGAVVLAACGFVYYRATLPPEASVAIAKQQDVVSTLAVSGSIEAVDQTEVSSQLAGARVSRVLVDLGDAVRPGQVIAEFENDEFLAAVDAARGQVLRAEANQSLQAVNAGNAARSLSLAEENLRSVTDLRLAVENARTQVRVTEQRLNQAKANFDRVSSGGRSEAVAVASAQLERAQALLSQREREAARASTLFADSAISKRELELAVTAQATAEEDVRVAQASLDQVRTNRSEDIQQARAGLREAQEAFEGAKRSLVIASQSLDLRLAAKQSVEQARTQRDAAVSSGAVASADRTAASATLRQAEANLAKTVVRSPIAGRIAERFVEPGQTLPLGGRILSIADASRLRVRLDVDEASLNRIRVGSLTTISVDAYPDLPLKGRISEIGSSANFQRGTVEVRVALDSVPSELKPDLTADANIETARFQNAIVIPRQAILNPDEGAQVYVLDGNTVVARAVRWARGNVTDAVILEGVKEGEQVLLEPRRFRPGQRVNPSTPKQEAR